MAALLGAGQLVLHGALGAFSSPAAPGKTGAPAHHPAAAVLAGLPVDAAHVDAAHGAAAHAHQLDSPWASALMLGGHTLATLACALLLAKGEDALWSLAAWLRPLVKLPEAVMPHAVAAQAASGWLAASAPLPWRNLRPDCRRGPPADVVLS
jgi:hypothetical protein